MPKREKKSLEQILLDYKVLTKEQIDSSLSQCQKTGKPLKEVLITGGFLSEDQLAPYLAEQLDVPYIDLNTFIIHPDVITNIPESIARKYRLVPTFKVKNSLTVALDALKRHAKFEIKPVMASPSAINNIIEKY